MSEQIAVLERSAIRRLDPEDAIAQAKKWADALMRVVKETRIAVNISGREYLKVEAWQTLARFNYCWIDTEWTRDIKDEEGRVLGVEARARLMSLDTGQSLGGAEGSCMMDEELEGRDGQVIERWSEYYAVKSMAQTRAQGKVGRMAYAWVAVLAGYESTPAEEMTGVSRGKQNLCPKCGKSAIIKGKAEYGGGWLCFGKKGGCGAKFTDAEWEAAGDTQVVNPVNTAASGPASPATGDSGSVTTAASPVGGEAAHPHEDKDFLLGRIKAVADKMGMKASERAELWKKHCGPGATPEQVDTAALADLYTTLVALSGKK